MSNVLISPINWAREAGVAFAMGSWVSTLPLTALLTNDLFEYARSTAATLVATKFELTFAGERRCNAFALLGLNVTPAALVRIRGYGATAPRIEQDFAGGDIGPFAFARASTATYFNAAGVLQVASSGVPRHDHNPATGEALGLLVEAEARENLIAHSNNLAGWASGSNANITANQGAAMDGTTTADRVTATTGGGNGKAVATISYSPSTQYAWSMVLKSEVGTSVAMVLVRAAMGNPEVQFNLSTGSVITSSGSGLRGFGIIPMGGGRYRCWMGFLTDGSAGSIQTELRLFDNADQVLVSDAQLEECANLVWPSSIIPTSGSTATRAAETADLSSTAFSDLWESGAGSAAIEYSFPAVEPQSGSLLPLFSFEGTGSRAVRLRVDDTSTDDVNLLVHDGSSLQANLTVTTTVAYTGAVQRSAAAWDTNDAIACHAGTLSSQDTSVTLPTLDRLILGADEATNASPIHIRWFAYWPVRLPSATLQAGTQDRDDYPLTSPITDGWVPLYPVVHEPEDGFIPWGRASADGAMPDDERPEEGTSFYCTLDEAVDIARIVVEIDDTANPAGYVQASLIWAGYGERPPLGVPVSELGFGYIEEARKRRALSSTLRARRLWIKPRVTGALRLQEQSYAFRTLLDASKRLGSTRPVLMMFDVNPSGDGAGVDQDRCSFVGVLDEPPPVENEHWDRFGWAFQLTAL